MLAGWPWSVLHCCVNYRQQDESASWAASYLCDSHGDVRSGQCYGSVTQRIIAARQASRCLLTGADCFLALFWGPAGAQPQQASGVTNAG